MPIIARESPGREPIAAGAYHVACCTIVDLGTQPPSNPKYHPRQMVLLQWELLDETVEYERDGVKQSFKQTISRSFGLSLGGGKKPTEFRKLLESWRGRPFTAEELAGFELRNVLGANGLLTVVHNESGGSVYANVGSVAPLMKGMPKRAPERKLLYFTLSDIAEGDALEWPADMPEWIREKIMKSKEYGERFGGVEPHDGAQYESLGDDDIPFD